MFQASGGHRGWAQRHPVRVGAFRGARLAGLHLHPPDGPDAATQRREASLPQHCPCRTGRHICRKVNGCNPPAQRHMQCGTDSLLLHNWYRLSPFVLTSLETLKAINKFCLALQKGNSCNYTVICSLRQALNLSLFTRVNYLKYRVCAIVTIMEGKSSTPSHKHLILTVILINLCSQRIKKNEMTSTNTFLLFSLE